MFDLDKVLAEGADKSRRKKFSFKFDGETFTLPNEVDVIALRSVVEGDLLTGLQRILSAEQFEKIRTSPTALTPDALRAVVNAYYDHINGLTLGELTASSTSSTRTARPSKRTSKRITTSRSRR